MKQLLSRLMVEEKGQGITEYALILGLVVFGIWLLVSQSGIAESINGIFANVASVVNDCGTSGCGGAGGGGS
jgi:Flp pilus assembly pilin Flp